jgi:hypothetical protein
MEDPGNSGTSEKVKNLCLNSGIWLKTPRLEHFPAIRSYPESIELKGPNNQTILSAIKEALYQIEKLAIQVEPNR